MTAETGALTGREGSRGTRSDPVSRKIEEAWAGLGVLLELAANGSVPLADLQRAVGGLDKLRESNLKLIVEERPDSYRITRDLSVRVRQSRLELVNGLGLPTFALDLDHAGMLSLVLQHLLQEARESA
jgi:hypothetical protein